MYVCSSYYSAWFRGSDDTINRPLPETARRSTTESPMKLEEPSLSIITRMRQETSALLIVNDVVYHDDLAMYHK